MSSFLFIGSPADEPHFAKVSQFFGTSSVPTWTKGLEYASDAELVAKKLGAKAIITTREDYLKKLLPAQAQKAAKISNYAGSILSSGREGIEVLVVDPLRQLYTKSHGEFLLRRYISKVTHPHKWRKVSDFNWVELDSEERYREAMDLIREQTILMSIDIETLPPNIIKDFGFTLYFLDGTSRTYVMRLDRMEKVYWMRNLNATHVPKVCQNGKYECAHFFAWGAPMVNYIADTKNAMHSWYAELPKDLGFITLFFVRNSAYWKDMAKSGEKLEQFEYNALDTWGTGEAFLSWLAEAPDWAWRNYITKFRLIPSIHRCEMRGIKRDEDVLYKAAKRLDNMMDTQLTSIRKMLGGIPLNPNSSDQSKRLLFLLGHTGKDRKSLPESSDEKTMQEAITKHPLSEVILGKVLEYRGTRKLRTTYLTTGDKAKEFKGRVLYSINPDGTDSGRAASKTHHFWTGLNIQNIPQDHGEAKLVKQSMVADEGFEFFEVDKSQAEARGVAFCSGDEALLRAINSGKDFHSLNASAFFGIPYEQIRRDAEEEFWDSDLGEMVAAVKAKTLNEEIRNLSKRVNHGANYNMGAQVLLDTMGSKNVRKAQILLSLNPAWTLIDVCKYLLHRYEVTYPIVKTVYYDSIKSEVARTSKMVGPTGWTRYCFGDPSKNKMDLNSLVAHKTQSLNAMDVDEGFLKIYNWQRENRNWDDLQIFTQIHDSILGQVRLGKRDLVYQMAELMLNPINITCSRGVTRTMIVPVDYDFPGKRWGGDIDEPI